MKKTTLALGIIGMLFSGYLSTVKFFGDTCAFDKSCPYFLDYPACYYGFAIFTIITLFFILDKYKVIQEKTADIAVLTISF